MFKQILLIFIFFLIFQQTLAGSTSSNINGIAVGEFNSCGLIPSGNIVCWGCNSPNNFTQCDVKQGAFTQIGGGNYHTCGLTNSGSILCWGCLSFDYGQCTVPVGFIFSGLAVGASHTCGIIANNRQVLCWGWNFANQLNAPPHLHLQLLLVHHIILVGYCTDLEMPFAGVV